MSVAIDWTKLCEGCGECCGPVPFEQARFDEIKNLAQRAFVIDDKTFSGIVIPVTENLNCIFLNSEKRCVIYAIRPDVCKLQGTIPALPCPILETAQNK